MKKEQLLEAIGYADDQFLMETENLPHRSRFRISRMVLVAAIISLLTVTAMASTGFFAGFLKAEDNGSSVSNLSTGTGNFAYAEDGIYYGVPGFIHKCDFNGNILKTYSLSDEWETPQYMFVTKDAVIYINIAGIKIDSMDKTVPSRDHFWGLRMQPKDGSEPVNICPGVVAISAYADGDQLYVTNGGTMLSRIDLVTLEQTELLENVNEYFVDENYIYAVQSGIDNCYYRSRKDVIGFEKIGLAFDPNKIIADGNDLYICQWLDNEEQKATGNRYQVNLVQDGETTALPVYSWLYQILDGSVLYLEEKTYSLKCYQVSTGETTVLAENVFQFTVLEDRYICINSFNAKPLIYDWQTKSYSQININKWS